MGFGCLSRNALHAITKPGVQNPHCEASWSTKDLLYRVQYVAARQRFDRCDLGSLSFNRKNHAGINSYVVHEYSARAAFATITHPLCASELKAISQCIRTTSSRGSRFGFVLVPVDGEFHRKFTRAVDRNFTVIRDYHFGAGHKRYSCRNAGDLSGNLGGRRPD